MTFLVWNVAAELEHLSVRGRVTAGRADAAVAGIHDAEEHLPAAPLFPEGALTVRQRFLLGKKIDVNQADIKEISGLPGLTDKVARALVSVRERQGGFACPEDLLAVPGIKEKRLKKILPFLCGFR